jgi:acyl phosphate:glycerol-3-phosphate acyltransferase
MSIWLTISVLLTAYALGSIPTALIYSRLIRKADIRTLGDGNMGATNIKHLFGFHAGLVVALIDILKGALAILLTDAFNLPLEMQLFAGAAVILGHDYPVFAQFKGGQGFATTTGVLLVLFPFYTLLGFVVYLFLFLVFHNTDIASGFGMGLIVLLASLNGAPLLVILFVVGMLLFIPLKQRMDRPRRQALKHHQPGPTGSAF